MLKLTSISPHDLGKSLRRRRRSAFIYHTFHQSVFIPSPQSVFYTDRHKFIHTHNLLQYYKVGDQASVEVEGVEEQMLIFLSSLRPGRQVKDFWIVLIWKIPACQIWQDLYLNRAVAHDARSQRGIWCYRTSASACFFGNDRSLRSRVRTRLITKCVYYEWVSDSFAYLSPCNNSWYARAYPRVKNVAVLTEDGAFARFFRPHPGGFDSSRVPTPGNLPSKAKIC